jgi:hypothetical protein
MIPSIRKLALTTHISVSVGWIGAVLAYLVLVLSAITGHDASTLRAAWIGMELIGWYLIVPLALAALLTGLVMAFGTPWGLFRHYWVLISFGLTAVATVVLLQHMPTVSSFARIAADADGSGIGALRGALPGELLHAGLGLVVLLAIEAMNVYKPRGMTAYGRRVSQRIVSSPARDDARSGAGSATTTPTPRWVHAVSIHAVGLVLLFAIVHLATGGLPQH